MNVRQGRFHDLDFFTARRLAACEQHEGKNGDDLMVREPNMASGWRRTVVGLEHRRRVG